MRGRRMRTTTLIAAAVVLALGLAACGDDAPTLPLEPGGTLPAPAISGDEEAWCNLYFEVDDWMLSLDPAYEPEDFVALAEEALPVWSQLLPGAPAPIRGDVAAIAEQLQRVAAGDVDAMFEAGYDDAHWNIEDFVFDECGFRWDD